MATSQGWRLLLAVGGATISSTWLLAIAGTPTPQILTGLPQQIVPSIAEVGTPLLPMQTGTVSLLGGSTSGSGTGGGGSDSGDGSGIGGAGGDGTGGTGGGGTGTSTGSSALDKMNAASWGPAAAANSEALGVNASALAATCVMESGCQNVGGPGSAGNITGAFQMTASTYQAMLAAALRENPSLSANIVPGLAGQNDPATQAIAAAEYLKQGAAYLERNGISNPTSLDLRGYYNFGPAAGAALANAGDSQPMSQILSGYSAQTLLANGINSSTTVGQWKASVAQKMGSAANIPVLNI